MCVCVHVCVISCRHPNDELNYCYYLIPSGKPGMCGMVKESDLARCGAEHHLHVIHVTDYTQGILRDHSPAYRIR